MEELFVTYLKERLPLVEGALADAAAAPLTDGAARGDLDRYLYGPLERFTASGGKRDAVHVFGNDYDTPDGTGVRDYIHVVDLARGHAAALAWMNGRSGVEVFNLGTGTGTSVLQIIEAFSKACGHEIPYVVDPRRPGDVTANYADCTKARELMGWEAKFDIEDMCRDSWNWQSKNPNGYEG